jgi:hypothetical protein
MKLVFSTNYYINPNQNLLEKKIKINKFDNHITNSYIPKNIQPKSYINKETTIVQNKSINSPFIVQNKNIITNSLSMNMFNRMIQTSDCNCGK